jgi:asparagine synthase (glutamine-hydrolysing)
VDADGNRLRGSGMCGLLVFFSSRSCALTETDAIEGALEGLHHRGPDETSLVQVDDDAVCGHKRLSIIDVAGSHQPLRYAGGRYTVVFNGEIYNYRELREELVHEHGAGFATDGDTEVLAAAYHHWGEQALHRLRGMFAFVIWDRELRRGFAARDRYGIKPLHYLATSYGLYLASEKKALLPFAAAGLLGEAGINAAGLSHYLTLQYVPEPHTLHRGIDRLGSGECLTWTPEAGVTLRRWYRPAFRPTPISDQQALYERIRTVLRESVRVHMRADVPVGAFLSSGIDSTAIVALAREYHPDILTFTVGYDVPGYSEIEVAQESARQLGVAAIPTTIGPQEVMEALPKIVWHLDDPVADPSVVPLYHLAKTAAEHVTVVLSGEGADELFGGYTIYREPLSLAGVQAMPEQLQKGLRAVARVVPDGVKGKSFVQRGTTPLQARYYGNARIFTEQDKRQLMRAYDPGVRHTDVTAPIYAEVPDLDPVTTMQYVDLYTWLRGDILVKADRMSMAHSLELRVPFLDHAVFEVAATIPTELKLPRRGNATKYALRRALAGVVPPRIVHRRKLGFPTPTRVWLAGPMHDWAHDVLSSSGADGLLNLAYAHNLLTEHRRREADHSRKLWTVLIFCLWHAMFVTRSLDPGISRTPSALLAKPAVRPKDRYYPL